MGKLPSRRPIKLVSAVGEISRPAGHSGTTAKSQTQSFKKSKFNVGFPPEPSNRFQA